MRPGRALKEMFARVLNGIGIAALSRALLWRDRTAILLYHDPDPAIMDRHLAFLKRRCRIVSLEEFLAVRESGGSKPGRSAVITIDDGHAGNAKLAEVFAKYGVKPTIFLCSQIVGTERIYWWQHPEARRRGAEGLKALPNAERLALLSEGGFMQDAPAPERHALTHDELRALGAVVSLQSHSRFHPILTKCDDTECKNEIEGSRREIEALSGAQCRDFAYPNGDYGAREIAVLKEAGYRSARTCDIGWNDARTDPFRLRALPIADDASDAWFALQLSGAVTYLRYLKGGSVTGRSPQS
jgi:peptidoglycan/xylan/chitin deacetylase (PgdA/CDA1 family)